MFISLSDQDNFLLQDNLLMPGQFLLTNINLDKTIHCHPTCGVAKKKENRIEKIPVIYLVSKTKYF